jgi:starvation-inducible DNA-binding protein
MKTNIGISDKNTQAVANALAKIVANEAVLLTKTRNAHWNIEGPDFHAMHLFFESQYNALDETIDSVAERIRSLGHYAPGTLKEFLELTSLTEKRGNKNNSESFLKDLVADHETIIIELRENVDLFTNKYKDAGTSDFITGLMEQHEKMAWMLRAHLK